MVLFMVGVSGCLLDRSPVDPDGGSLDGALPDAGPDAAAGDAGADAGPLDAGPPDAGPLDAGPLDAGPPDAGPVDACVPTPELCNGVDDDCDPSSADGADEPSLGTPCDSGDDDLCTDDAVACVEGALTCVDDGSDAEELETCNGIDDDCNPVTADGSESSMLGQPCDSEGDDDLCEDDSFVCVTGALTCVDDGSDAEEAELCNGMDDDCDGSLADDAADDPSLGMACDGPDADVCEGGVLVCVGGAAMCTDSAADAVETCNAMDEDCDGAIDEGIDCGCDRVTAAGRVYLFCADSGDRRTWTEARDFCRARGYELVSIESVEEQRFVAEQARARRSDRGFWIGANDSGSEGNFVWVDEPPRALTYTYWNVGEPNDVGNEDCVELLPSAEPTFGLPGGWNDDGCSANTRFICEAGP